MKIFANDTKQMVAICSELARQGITFEANWNERDGWVIRIVGW